MAALPATQLQLRLALPAAFHPTRKSSHASCSLTSLAPGKGSQSLERIFCSESRLPCSRPVSLYSNARLRFSPRAQSVASSGEKNERELEEGSVSLVLLAGGVGKRMGASTPKQYLPLLDKPIALHSFEMFCELPEIGEIIVVCDPSYRDVFQNAFPPCGKELKFALPGKERQDSTFNGLNSVRSGSKLVAIHDSARPLITAHHAKQVLFDAQKHGAAALGVPVKATIKQVNGDGFVAQTLDRKILWEIQTPQVIEPELLKKGFAHVLANDLEVTDDVSIIEYLDQNVFITHGCYTNLKVTTPEDLLLAEKLLISKEVEEKSVVVQ